MKNILLTIFFSILMSCGSGSNSSPPESEQITFKNIPDSISIFE